jgi:hypothetical protein
MIIAVDFDKVLSLGDYEFPAIGEPCEMLFSVLKKLQDRGNKLILWTCRENTKKDGNALDKAVAWCKDYGLEFDAINDNLPEIKEKYKCNSRKIYADLYIDDKNWNPDIKNFRETGKIMENLHEMIEEYFLDKM